MMNPSRVAGLTLIAALAAVSAVSIAHAKTDPPKNCAKSACVIGNNTSSGAGVLAESSTGIGDWVFGYSGNGVDSYGNYIGVIGRANSYPFVATDANGNDLFWVDIDGNVNYKGSLIQFIKTRGGAAHTYGSASASPTIEDSGTAHLVNGAATIALDRTFAQAIDLSTPYRVFLTPGGDTKGLYVTAKTASGFVVREVQQGHDSLDFDYRILATQAGHAGERAQMVDSKTRIPSAAPQAR
jgi:hypothetical protein